MTSDFIFLPRFREFTSNGRQQGSRPTFCSLSPSWDTVKTVSYTHLDVYKRQVPQTAVRILLAGNLQVSATVELMS